MNLVHNPYLNRTAIRDDRDFFGRLREIQTLFTRIDASQPQCVSVVGERRIGKSSLLRVIYRQRGTFLRRPDEFIFVLLDLQEKMHAGVSDFFVSLIEEVALACQDRALTEQPPTYETIRKLVATLDRRRMKLVLLLDEFDAITQNKNFGLEFFSFLRSLPNNYSVSFIVTSVQDLQKFCHSDEIAGSPFFNIFHKLNLGCLLPEEALRLIREPSAAAGFPLQRDAPSIVALAGYFPFFLQLACCAFFEFYRDHPGQTSVEQASIVQTFTDEAHDHLKYLWAHLSEREREVCLSLTARRPLDPAGLSCLEALSRRGFARADPSGPHLFSPVFEAFVRVQTGENQSSVSPPPREPRGTPTEDDRDPRNPEDEVVDKLLGELKNLEDVLREKHLRHLSVLYADMVGSTSAGERLGPFYLRILVKRLEERVRPVLVRHGGTFVKLAGDAVIARFDRPEDATEAGIAILDEFTRYNARVSERDQIHVKVAIHHGEAVITRGDVFGDAINGAERVLRETTADQLLVSGCVVEQMPEERAMHFVDVGSFELKGKAQPMHLFRYRPGLA